MAIRSLSIPYPMEGGRICEPYLTRFFENEVTEPNIFSDSVLIVWAL
jgi:hypothetical protein